MKLIWAVLILFCVHAHADSITQTDWSGGPGFPGPVLDLGNTFDVDTSVDWTVTGEVGPGRTEVQYWLDSFIGWPGNAFPVDLDGDGDQDVAGASFGELDIYCWENLDGSGTSWARYTVDPFFRHARGMDAADFDGDGAADLIGANYMQHVLKWWENPGNPSGSWTGHEIQSSWVYCSSVDAEDIDGDDDPDFVANSSYAHTVAWWENDGTGTIWTQHIITSTLSGVDDCLASDLDGDGDFDVAASTIDLGEIRWYENLGGGAAWTVHTVRTDMSLPGSIHDADVDGDGDPDLLAACWETFQIVWLENTGSTIDQWPLHLVTNNCPSLWDVEAGDFDSDGDQDVAATAVLADSLWWYENTDGAGGAWTPHLLDGDYSAYRVSTGDLNGDGRTDILCGGYHTLQVCWWDVRSLTGCLESSILDTQEEPDWGWLSYTCELHAGTAVAMQVRASDDFGDMGAWSDDLPLYGGSLDGILDDGDRYFQYRALITTTPDGPDPRLEEVTITWDQLGTGGGEAPPGFVLMPVSPNPSPGLPSIVFGQTSGLAVEISVYDISGRVVRETAPVDYQPGWHSVQLGDLGTGVYFVRVRAGSFEASERFVVIE